MYGLAAIFLTDSFCQYLVILKCSFSIQVMPAVVNLMKEEATLVTLIKPQFEARRSQVSNFQRSRSALLPFINAVCVGYPQPLNLVLKKVDFLPTINVILH